MSSFGKKTYRLNRTLHRDLGHLLVGLTLLFAISGIALNHLHDFNPNYYIDQFSAKIDGLPHDFEQNKQIAQLVAHQLKIDEKLRHVHDSSPTSKIIFFEQSRVELDLVSGEAIGERVAKRPLLFPLNQMHLNRAGTWWIYLSDIYAVILIFLAISGLFMAKGLRRKVKLRGYLLLALGILIPIIYWIFFSDGGASGPH